jgi:hypothetical protein
MFVNVRGCSLGIAGVPVKLHRMTRWEDLNLGGRLFLFAHSLVCGPVERGLCDFCLCLSTGVDERRAVLLPVLLPFYCGAILVVCVCG